MVVNGKEIAYSASEMTYTVSSGALNSTPTPGKKYVGRGKIENNSASDSFSRFLALYKFVYMYMYVCLFRVAAYKLD